MADFHFIRPLWLLALPLLLIILYLLKQLKVSSSGWQQVLPAHLSTKLITANSKQGQFSLWLPAIIFSLTVIALAGPTWQKISQPVYKLRQGSVIIMDMSNSMYATDLSPNRLTQARFKAIDLLTKLNEGDVGLIAYAGESFVITPLTEDINNIRLLLPSLSPELMPVQGSNPLHALTMANDMLLNAGHMKGDIYWLTDDVDNYDVKEISQFINTIEHRINILGIGTSAPAPIKMPDGKLLKDDSGNIVLPHLPKQALQGIAQRAGGSYSSITTTSADIETLISQRNLEHKTNTQEQAMSQGDQYREAGPYLVLVLLVLLLPYFRRGIILSTCIGCMLLWQTPPVFAEQAHMPAHETINSQPQRSNTEEQPKSSSFWDNLWQTPDQQAQQAFEQEDYQTAANKFTQPNWQGSAYYKNGDFEKALKAFQQHDDATSLYNQGNTLAQLGQIDEAIKAYQQALKKQPNFTEAEKNKQLLEALKKQQEQQNNSQNNSQDKSQGKSGNNSDNGQQSDGNEHTEQEPQQNQQGSNENKDQQNSHDQNGENANNNEQNKSDNNKEENVSEKKQNSAQNSSTEQQNNQQDSDSQQQGDSSMQADAQDENDNQQEQMANKENTNNQASNEKVKQAQFSEEELANQLANQEEQQKHQLLLNKVTDDPYLLLRNKMQLEHQKRRYQPSGVDKKW